MNPDGQQNQPQTNKVPAPETNSGAAVVPKKKKGISRVRTYKDDIKNVIRSQNVTTSKILLAEQKRKRAERITRNQSLKSPYNRLYLLLAVLFGVIAIAAIVYATNLKPRTTGVEVVIERPTFFDVEEVVAVETFQQTPATIQRDLTTKMYTGSSQGNIRSIVLVETLETVTNQGIVREQHTLDTADFINILSARTPSTLIRAISDEFLIGSFQTLGKSEPFILLRAKDFQSAFAGMIQWESFMAQDFKKLFRNLSLPDDSITKEVVNRRTSSSDALPGESGIISEVENKTGQKNISKIFGPNAFSDRVISNRDTRVIIDNQGRVRILYTFIGDHILIAQEEAVVAEVAARLRTTKLLQ